MASAGVTAKTQDHNDTHARAAFDEHTALHGSGSGRDLHEYRHCALTGLGQQDALLLMLMAKSRRQKSRSTAGAPRVLP